jgi:hypothetical protein
VLEAGHEALLDRVTEPGPEEFGSLRDEVLRLARMVETCLCPPPEASPFRRHNDGTTPAPSAV